MQAVCVGGSSASYLRGRGPRPAATGSGATSKVTSTFSALPAGLQARHRGKPHSQLVVTAALSTIDQARHGMKISLVNPPSLSCVKSGSSGLQRSKQQRRGLVSSTASSSSRRTAVRVQASLVARVLRIVRAYLGNAVSSIEQPEVLLRQAVEDMQADLAAARRAQVRVAADQRLAAKRAAAAAANADTWQRRAEQALLRGDEELAKEALRRKRAALQEQESEAGHASDLVAAGVRLAEAVAALSARLKEAAAKEGHLTARAHAARTMQEQQQALQELAGTVPKPGSAWSDYERLAEKVEVMEATAAATAQINAGSAATGDAASASAGQRLLALESDARVEHELAALKHSVANRKKLPPSGGSGR